LSFVRGSTTINHNSATAADASLAGKTVFLGNNRAVNGGSACVGNSGCDISAEESVSSDVANARDRGGDHDQFAACRSGLAKFTSSYHRGDGECGIDHDEFAACRNDLAKFTSSYHRGDAECGSDYDEFAACRNGLAKFTRSYRHGDSVRF
jgi:hypothetical protein